MARRLSKSSRVALSLTVAVTAMVFGGTAYAQAGLGDANIIAGTSAGGSLRNAPDNEATDQPASDNTAAEPAADAEPPASAPPADEPQAEADEGTTQIRRSRATYDSDPAEPE